MFLKVLNAYALWMNPSVRVSPDREKPRDKITGHKVVSAGWLMLSDWCFSFGRVSAVTGHVYWVSQPGILRLLSSQLGAQAAVSDHLCRSQIVWSCQPPDNQGQDTLWSESRDASSEPASILGPSILAFGHLSWIRMSFWDGWGQKADFIGWCLWAVLIYTEWGSTDFPFNEFICLFQGGF